MGDEQSATARQISKPKQTRPRPILKDDPTVWQLGWLAVVALHVAIGGLDAPGIFAAYFLLLLAAWWSVRAAMPEFTRMGWVGLALGALFIVLIGWGGAALGGLLLAPAAVLMAAALLPRKDIAPAAADWAGLVVSVLLVAVGLAGVQGLAGVPGTFGSMAVPVLAALIGFNAGGRAARLQGMPERMGLGLGSTLVLLATLTFSPPALAGGCLLGVGIGLLGALVAPAPPVVAHPAARGLVTAAIQLAFVAPAALVTIWAVRTFL